MAKNIEINVNNGDGTYEVLYPKVSLDNTVNGLLASKVLGALSLSNIPSGIPFSKLIKNPTYIESGEYIGDIIYGGWDDDGTNANSINNNGKLLTFSSSDLPPDLLIIFGYSTKNSNDYTLGVFASKNYYSNRNVYTYKISFGMGIFKALQNSGGNSYITNKIATRSWNFETSYYSFLDYEGTSSDKVIQKNQIYFYVPKDVWDINGSSSIMTLRNTGYSYKYYGFYF